MVSLLLLLRLLVVFSHEAKQKDNQNYESHTVSAVYLASQKGSVGKRTP